MIGIRRAAAVAVGWVLARALSGARVARWHRSHAAGARQPGRRRTAAWRGLAGLTWAVTSLGTGSGEVVFLVGGPLGWVSVFSQSSGDDNGSRNDHSPDDDGNPPEWDWKRFERDLAEYEAGGTAPGS